MKNIKKYFLIVVLSFVVLALTGCVSNTPEGVAEAMVKRLSENNYEDIGELFYHEGYFTDEAFKRKMEYESLNIKGNQIIKVKEVGEEYTDDDEYTAVDVQITIDDNLIFKVHTIKVDGKWYVYDSDFIGRKSLKIIVPSGSKVVLDGSELSSDYLSDSEKTMKYTHPNSNSVSVEVPVDADVYVLPKTISGGFAIQLSYGDKVINDAIGYHSSKLDIHSGEYGFSETEDFLIYNFYASTAEKLDTNDKLVNAYLKDFISTMYTNLNSKKEFSEIEKNFGDSYKLVAKTSYNDALESITLSDDDITDSSYYYSNFTLSSFSIKDIKQFSSDSIVVSVYYKLNYNYKYRYYSGSISSRSSYDYVSDIYVLSKSGDSYSIKDVATLIGGID